MDLKQFSPGLPKVALLLVIALSMSLSSIAGDVYYSTYSTANCNAFSSLPYIGSGSHRPILGQPKFDNSEHAVVLECSRQNPNAVALSAGYSIASSFFEGHTYKITIKSKQENAGSTLAYLMVALCDGSEGFSPYCNGQAQDVSELYPNGDGYPASTSSYTDHIIYLTASQYRNGIKFKSLAGPFSAPTKIYIKSIIWEDITPPFSLTASSNTRLCGTQNPVTFTVQNPSNAPISQWKFYLEPGKWEYDGIPAPSVITAGANFITLTPVACEGDASVTAKVISNGNTIAIPYAQNMTVTHYPYSISGPSTLPSVSGSYELKGNPLIFPTPPAALPCYASVNWSISSNLVASLYVASPTLVGITPAPTNANIILTAEVEACGKTTTVSKNITITHSFFMSDSIEYLQGKNELFTDWAIKSLSPNPTNGVFTVELTQPVKEAQVRVKDITGRVLSTQKYSGQIFTIDLSNPAGVYFVEIVSGTHSVVKKIIKK